MKVKVGLAVPSSRNRRREEAASSEGETAKLPGDRKGRGAARETGRADLVGT